MPGTDWLQCEETDIANGIRKDQSQPNIYKS